MSAQPSQHISTRVLIAEKSENAAYALDSTLRDAGIATKLEVSDDLAHIAQLVADGEVDIALLTDKLEGLEKFLPRIHANAPHVPLLLLVSEEPQERSWTVAEALNLGATDLVQANDAQHLSLVVHRELGHVYQRDHAAQLRRALKEAEQRCQLLLQGSEAAIAYVHEGMHIHANQGYLSLFGYSDADDLCSASLVDLLSADCAEALKLSLKELRNGKAETSLKFRSNETCGEVFNGSMSLTHSQYEGETCLQVTVRQDDGSQDKDGQHEHKSSHSNVTPLNDQELGVPGFVRSAETLFNSENVASYILCLHIDNFTQTQHAYGLLGAESIARQIWIKISDLAQQYPLTRLSTHQFAIALDVENREAALKWTDKLRTQIGELMLEIHDKTVRPTISIAGALMTDDHGVGSLLDAAYSNLQELLEKQDANVVSLPAGLNANDDADEEAEKARGVLNQITHAIDNKAFVLLYQPIISLRGDSDEHYEVFLRMLDEHGKQVVPSEFLQTAIDNNVAGKIDRWVILQSIKMLSVHRAKGNATRLTINLTANSVIDREFPQWLGVAMKAARLPSDAVIFQITEKDATTYLRQTREFVERLREMHCRTSLSRFGLVEDPFETLRHLTVEMVKLDGSCIDSLETDGDDRAAVMDTINKLQAQGKLTVVPMVENANILSTLWQAGANYIQGHYLQEPSTEMDYDFSTEE